MKQPQIRAVSTFPVTHAGQKMVLLQDPLGIASNSVLIPPQATPLLALCDGTRDIQTIRDEMFSIYGLEISIEEINAWIEIFNDAVMLDNNDFQDQKADALKVFRAQEYRKMTLSNDIYPAEPDELRQALDAYMPENHLPVDVDQIRGMICPHIDYSRGWRVYARVMADAHASIQDAELIVILGTDHFDDDNAISLTMQSYQTPYGVLQSWQDGIQSIHESIPEVDVFNGELRHRFEHSIELALVWLHHMRGGVPCDVLPILCGSHTLFIDEQMNSEHAWVPRFIDSIRQVAAERKTLIVAAADLAHVGPAFGGEAISKDQKVEVALADERLLQEVKRGNSSAFIDEINAVEDRYNVCGITPIYLLLRLLEPASGEINGYEFCPADQHDTSWVSICGGLLR